MDTAEPGPGLAHPSAAAAREVLASLASRPAFRFDRRLIEPLTQRETQILALICNGDSNQEIAEQLRLSVNAVKFHLQNVFGKLGVRRRTQAVAVAVHLRLVIPAWLGDPSATVLLPSAAGDEPDLLRD